MAITIVVYGAYPEYLENKVLIHDNSQICIALAEVMNRRMHWFQYLGIACGLVCAFFAIRNFLIAKSPSYTERDIIGLITRLLGREIN